LNSRYRWDIFLSLRKLPASVVSVSFGCGKRANQVSRRMLHSKLSFARVTNLAGKWHAPLTKATVWRGKKPGPHGSVQCGVIYCLFCKRPSAARALAGCARGSEACAEPVGECEKCAAASGRMAAFAYPVIVHVPSVVSPGLECCLHDLLGVSRAQFRPLDHMEAAVEPHSQGRPFPRSPEKDRAWWLARESRHPPPQNESGARSDDQLPNLLWGFFAQECLADLPRHTGPTSPEICYDPHSIP
jgi:hypothetical protein